MGFEVKSWGKGHIQYNRWYLSTIHSTAPLSLWGCCLFFWIITYSLLSVSVTFPTFSPGFCIFLVKTEVKSMFTTFYIIIYFLQAFCYWVCFVWKWLFSLRTSKQTGVNWGQIIVCCGNQPYHLTGMPIISIQMYSSFFLVGFGVHLWQQQFNNHYWQRYNIWTSIVFWLRGTDFMSFELT